MIRDPTPERLIGGQKSAFSNIFKLIKRLPRRIRFGGGGGSSAAVDHCPFDITLTDKVGPNVDINIRPGTINQLVPTNIFSLIDYDPTTVVYVKVHATTNGKEVTGATIVANTTPSVFIPATSGGGATEFDVLVAILNSGQIVRVLTCGNINAVISQTFLEDKPSPTPGTSPFIRWYTWIITVV